MKRQTATDKSERQRRDTASPSELRDLQKLVEGFAEQFSFARDEVERLQQKTASVFAAWRKREAGHRAEHHRSRAYLAALTKGGVERWVTASNDEEMKAFFRRVWRDDSRPAPASTTQLDEKQGPAGAQGNEAASTVPVELKTTVIEVPRLGGPI